MNNTSSYIDHTLLNPEATVEQIEKLCKEAIKHSFASVCIPPVYVPLAAQFLQGQNPVKVCTVVGFPLGYNLSRTKAFEAQQAILMGADEIDMVINQAMIKNKDWKGVENDIKEVKIACQDKLLKVILETAHLNDNEIIKACKLAETAGADFVKTSTGFGHGGASFEAVKLMKSSISKQVKIKASGGIRDAKTAQAYIDLGVSRIGTSSGVAIVEGTESENNY